MLAKIKSFNTSSAITALLADLKKLKLWDKLTAKSQARLLAKSGMKAEAAVLESEIARQNIREGKTETARHYLIKTLDHLTQHTGCPNNDILYVKSALDLSRISWAIGKGLEGTPAILRKAMRITDRLGDKRSRALIKMHLGLSCYYADRRQEALEFFSIGEQEIYELGDDDILLEAAEFLSLFYAMQGKFRMTLKYGEQAFQLIESRSPNYQFTVLAPLGVGYSCMYLGQFNRAVGHLDYAWRWAKRESNFTLACSLRAVLGTALLLVDRKQEALMHLEESLQQASGHGNDFAELHSEYGIAYYHFLENRIDTARKWVIRTQSKKSAGIIRQFASPWILEMLFEFDKQGFEPIPQFGFNKQYERIMREPSIHLRGTALRLKAKQDMENNRNGKQTLNRLLTSQKYLEESGDPCQLAKTQIEIAFFT